MEDLFQNTGLVWLFLKRLTIALPYDPATPHLGIYSKNLKTGVQTKTCTHVFIVALFIVIKTWNQLKCSNNEGINKMWYTYTMEYYLANKRDEVLIHAITWINREDIMLSKISHIQKDQYCMISFI